MANLKAIRTGDKIRIIEHNNSEYIGKTGILLRAQIPRPAIKGQVIKWKVCKVKLDETDEIVDCILCQLTKVK